jgi:hypothetical protein
MRCGRPAPKASFRSLVDEITWAEMEEQQGACVKRQPVHKRPIKFAFVVAISWFRPMCRVAAPILKISLLLTFSGCGGRVSVQGLSDSQKTLSSNSAAEDAEPVKVRSFEF